MIYRSCLHEACFQLCQCVFFNMVTMLLNFSLVAMSNGVSPSCRGKGGGQQLQEIHDLHVVASTHIVSDVQVWVFVQQQRNQMKTFSLTDIVKCCVPLLWRIIGSGVRVLGTPTLSEGQEYFYRVPLPCQRVSSTFTEYFYPVRGSRVLLHCISTLSKDLSEGQEYLSWVRTPWKQTHIVSSIDVYAAPEHCLHQRYMLSLLL